MEALVILCQTYASDWMLLLSGSPGGACWEEQQWGKPH